MLFPSVVAWEQSLDDQIRQKFLRQFVLRELPIDSAAPGLELMSAGGAVPKIENFTFAGVFRPFGRGLNCFAVGAFWRQPWGNC